MKLQILRRLGKFVLATKSSAKARQELFDAGRWVEPVTIEGASSALSIVVSSNTEYGRARKFKEPWSVDWVNSLPIDAVLYDVGANVGILSLIAGARKEVSQVVSIEPFFKNYASLSENILLNGLSQKITPIAAGLGNETAFMSLNLENTVSGGALHSFGKILSAGPERTGKCVGEHRCPCYRLDDLAKFPGLRFPTHIKVDVDGFELEVLEGAMQTLSDPRLVGLQIETADTDASLPRRSAVIALMDRQGYDLANAIDHQSTKLNVFDLQFVSRSRKP
jgi:FkbM family methyltransferase